ncbi:MAG: GNAT family N-acetyltransferase, partial [Pirellulales bacterium]
GLLEARRGDRQVGAVWAEVQAGAVGSLWPPVLAVSEGDQQVADTLLLAACEYLKNAGAVMVQAVLSPDDRLQATRLTTARFVWMADLLYLASTEHQFPRVAPAPSLQFESYRTDAHERMKDVIRRTYTETLDCPKLSGVREIDDVLSGYRATGQFKAPWWLFVRSGARDIGCLFLTDHPQSQQVELIYMGIVPEARGKGCGILITGHAQWLTRLAERPRLVLAVDASNGPALSMYDAAGFVAWAKRSVFMRSLNDAALLA